MAQPASLLQPYLNINGTIMYYVYFGLYMDHVQKHNKSKRWYVTTKCLKLLWDIYPHQRHLFVSFEDPVELGEGFLHDGPQGPHQPDQRRQF